jgi:hypothetical protein
MDWIADGRDAALDSNTGCVNLICKRARAGIGRNP